MGEFGKMLMAIGNGHKIRQVDIASIINTISLTVLQSHTYSQNDICFFSYHSLTNNEYIIINKLTFTDALHIPMLGANLISLSVLYHKGALVQS